ncbi:hypothetical protein [Pseudovibrio sp. Tun.PSC04-5.I4]|uniref:RipA family octameric membrane protein n=1 Tax=Pseudovibrio sp. Tun.PSC04-5.I4 TaxID=1798213 RepID=UPI00087FB5C4|nr:hypothetical protein [Pseudovibrio sp. Tun.PSC04-5.I4]SDR47319.1 hypothetical protein SAMN04515695_5770 [Pseudovibrio sp. Tun.PSC04-5.I4]
MPETKFSQEQYVKEFYSDKDIRKVALNRALDTRKFEIELYWKRATYFWTFIGATLAGYLAVQVSTASTKEDLSIVLSCVGLVFSVAWMCVNRGSKHWQENWEKHVDMLEDQISGPLYKVVLTRRKPCGFTDVAKHLFTGPSPLSVSKINQIISLYISILWGILLFKSASELEITSDTCWFHLSIISLSILACVGFFSLGRSYQGGSWHGATIRTSEINNNS